MKKYMLTMLGMGMLVTLTACAPKLTNEEAYSYYQKDIGHVNLGNLELENIPNLCDIFIGEDQKNIKSIDLYANKISKLDYNFSCFPNLEELNISYNEISIIENIGNLTGLKKLSLHKNKISEIQGLENLVNLEELNLAYNTISKVEGLENLKKLKILELQHNIIAEKPNLSNFPELKTIKLEYNTFNK